MKPRVVTIFTKPECGLCEEAEEVIEAVRARKDVRPFKLERRNILEDLADYERYKHDIPVVLVDGREIARHHLDERALIRGLNDRGGLAIVVMTKFPAAGRVKTRLVPPLSAEQAARLHEAFLLHLLQRLHAWRVVVCFDPPQREAEMRRLVDVELIPQQSGDLGQRLAAAAAASRPGAPADYLIFLGVDSPDVPEAYLHRVAELSAGHDVVIAPADDGGYWSVALGPRVDAEKCFADIEWSTGRELAQTLERAKHLGYNVALADQWADVDRPEDLRRLLERLKRSGDVDDRRLLDRLSFLPDGVV
jgi:rSAM/selenodomain-associated transferase 1